MDEKYWYRINENNLPYAQSVGCDTSYLYIGRNDKRCNISKKLPYVFEKFIFIDTRMDLLLEYNISDVDNEFDKLYKVALKPELLFHNEYWIWTE